MHLPFPCSTVILQERTAGYGLNLTERHAATQLDKIQTHKLKCESIIYIKKHNIPKPAACFDFGYRPVLSLNMHIFIGEGGLITALF